MKFNALSVSKLIFTTLFLILLSFSVYARSTQLVEPNPVTISCDLPENKMKAGIRNGGAMRGWVIVGQAPGNIELRYVKGNNKHAITVDVSYTANTFAVKYKDSINLNYEIKKDVRYLHPNAVGWMANLSADIQMNADGQCFES
jgi:hypothetical protein